MAQPPPRVSLAELPSELIPAVLAVVVDANRDADLVAVFLRRLGIQCIPPGFLPTARRNRFLRDLGAAMRLVVWEYKGLTIHREAGLPSAIEAIKEAFRWVTADDDPDPGSLSIASQVVKLSIDRFSWHAKTEWGADIVLGFPDEEAALDALAEFLWQNRQVLPPHRSNGES